MRARGEVLVIGSGVSELSCAIEMLHVYPHASTVVLGGVAVEDEDARHRPDEAEAILRRCAAVEPRLAGVEILGFRTGVRSARLAVRVEAEVLAGTTVSHDYGHGGAGVRLSWGCAWTVRDLAELAGRAL